MRARATFARRLAVVAAAISAGVGVCSAWHGMPTLATHLRDDAFYEFCWAWNLAHGNGPCVSDGIATSGVQPLWTMLLAVVALLTDELPRIAPLLGLACHAIAATLWLREGRRTWHAWVVALFWLGNPLLLREAQNGQETALACLFATAMFCARRASGFAFASIASLAVLARADLFALAMALTTTRRASWRSKAITAVVAIAPWLLFQRICGGGWMPDSAQPMAWLAHANFERALPPAVDAYVQLEQWWRYLRPALLGAPFAHAGVAGWAALVAMSLARHLLPLLRYVPIAAVGAAWAVGASDLAVPLGAALLVACFPIDRARSVRIDAASTATAIALASIVFVHWSLRWHPRDYYMAPLAVGACIGLRAMRWHPTMFALLACWQLAWQVERPWPLEQLAGQRAMQAAGAALQPLLGFGARVGCFNSGIVSWEQLRRGNSGARIVNCDGVVNASAFVALQRAELSTLLDERGVRFLLDYPVQWSMDVRLPHACGPWFEGGQDPSAKLVELARCVEPMATASRPLTDAFVLMWRKDMGEPPALPRTTQWIARASDGTPVLWFVANAGDGIDLEQGTRAPFFIAPQSGNYLLPIPGQGRVYLHGDQEPIAPALLR